MLFCQLGRAHSLREIEGGLKSCEGKLAQGMPGVGDGILLPQQLQGHAFALRLLMQLRKVRLDILATSGLARGETSLSGILCLRHTISSVRQIS